MLHTHTAHKQTFFYPHCGIILFFPVQIHNNIYYSKVLILIRYFTYYCLATVVLSSHKIIHVMIENHKKQNTYLSYK